MMCVELETFCHVDQVDGDCATWVVSGCGGHGRGGVFVYHDVLWRWRLSELHDELFLTLGGGREAAPGLQRPSLGLSPKSPVALFLHKLTVRARWLVATPAFLLSGPLAVSG